MSQDESEQQHTCCRMGHRERNQRPAHNEHGQNEQVDDGAASPDSPALGRRYTQQFGPAGGVGSGHAASL